MSLRSVCHRDHLCKACAMCAAGITGGFAGGERGVQQFVEKGELELVAPGKGEAQHAGLLHRSDHCALSVHRSGHAGSTV